MGCIKSKPEESGPAGQPAEGATTEKPAESAPTELKPAETESTEPAVASGDRAADVAQEAFQNAAKSLLLIAIDGYPRAIRSTLARRNELLRKHCGDAELAAEEALGTAGGFTEEAKQFLLCLVPYIGIPTSVVYPLWKDLRLVCLVAGVFGHDLQDADVQVRVMYAASGITGGAVLGAKALEKAVQMLWAKVAGPARKVIPVGKVVSGLADIEGKVREAAFAEFRGGPGVTQFEYLLELDPPPTLADFAQLLKDVGVQTVDQVIQKGREMADAEKRQELQAKLVGLGQAAAGTALDVGRSSTAAATTFLTGLHAKATGTAAAPARS